MNSAKEKAAVQVMPRVTPVVQSVGAGQVAAHMEKILSLLGEDPSREGLVRTPERYEKAMRYLLSGYQTNLESIVNGALFTQKIDEMVVVKNIEFFSMC